MSSLDMNVSNYTLSELMAIVELEDLEPQDIIENTNYYIRKYKTKNPQMAVFFKEIQSQLLQYAEGLEPDTDDENNNDNKIVVEGFGNMSNEAVYPAGDNQINDWYTNQNLRQSDENQTNKITNRQQKIQVFGNEQATMKQEQLATTDTYNLPVKQDSLNPNLKNTINRFVNLDSQFRQYTCGTDSQSTNYMCDLSDTLKNALKLSLYSYQIPFSWYTIDTAYGNTCLWISDASSSIIVPVSVPSGNYSQEKFITQLNLSFTQSGFTFPARTNTVLYSSPPYPSPPLAANTPAYFNSNSGIITLFLADGIYNGIQGSFNITTQTQIIFFDFTGILQCDVNCYSKSNHYFNNTLGWLMGYRLPYLNVDLSGNTAGAILDLTGTKYLILVIDDYNQNHVNNSLVSISQFSNTLKMPTYYSPDLPYTCITPAQQVNNLTELVNGVVVQSIFDNQTPNAQNGLLIAGKYQEDYTSTQVVLPSAPRTLTNAQLYTINSINNNNNNLTNYLAKAPTSSDILALIPVKTSVGVPTGTLLVEFSGSLQDSERTYFGPVNIERMAVKLLDDKGNVLNLNGNDWCVSLIVECLYQY
jgi:hypothetical protein